MRTDDDRLRVSGLRDYSSWGFTCLPGRVGPMDLDAVVHRASSNRFLVAEFKQPGERLNDGQKITLYGLAKLPQFTVVILEGLEGGPFHMGTVSADGVAYEGLVSVDEWGAWVGRWWQEAGP